MRGRPVDKGPGEEKTLPHMRSLDVRNQFKRFVHSQVGGREILIPRNILVLLISVVYSSGPNEKASATLHRAFGLDNLLQVFGDLKDTEAKLNLLQQQRDT